jgi:3-oxoacyl-[acyl-carrier protein] reductase
MKDLGGSIILISSAAGIRGVKNALPYAVVKGAIPQFTRAMALELSAANIRVNCVTPAAVKTPLFSQMTQQQIDWMLSKIPAGRFGEIAEVAALVCWLASDECSFSTGAVFDISGGRATY